MNLKFLFLYFTFFAFFFITGVDAQEAIPNKYFLTSDEISASRSDISRNEITPYTFSGNSISMLINGDEVFSALYKDLNATQDGDFIWMTAWDISPDIMLMPDSLNSDSAALSKIKNVLIAAIDRKVQLRILINYNAYNLLRAMQFCAPLNKAAGETVCAPDERHNSIFGNLHQKAWVIKRNNETVAYVGSMDIAEGRYDTSRHDKDENRQTEPSFPQNYYGWTDGMLLVKGTAVVDLARHLYQQFSDPKQPLAFYSFPKINWPEISVPFYNTATQVQVLFTAGLVGASKYGYYSNWAPAGETSVLAATLKAIKQAKEYIFISDQFLWYPPILEAIAQQLPKIKAVVLVTNSHIALSHQAVGYDIQTVSDTKRYFQYNAWKSLMNEAKVTAYQLIKEGMDKNSIRNIIYTHWKALIIDDNFAIIGSTGVEQAGMTNDLDISLGIYDPHLVKEFRQKLWSEYLNLPYSGVTSSMDDPVLAIETLWPDIAAKNGRVRVYWPEDISYQSIFRAVFQIFEPCGYLDTKLCQ